MNTRSKTDVFNRIVRKLNDEIGITNITLDRSTDFNFECVILSKMKLIFNLRSGADILIIKLEGKNNTISDDELNIVGLNLIKDNDKLNVTAYENKLVIQSVIPLLDCSEAEAIDSIFQNTMKVIDMIRDNQSIFENFENIAIEQTNMEEKKELNSSFDENEGKNEQNIRESSDSDTSVEEELEDEVLQEDIDSINEVPQNEKETINEVDNDVNEHMTIDNHLMDEEKKNEKSENIVAEDEVKEEDLVNEHINDTNINQATNIPELNKSSNDEDKKEIVKEIENENNESGDLLNFNQIEINNNKENLDFNDETIKSDYESLKQKYNEFPDITTAMSSMYEDMAELFDKQKKIAETRLNVIDMISKDLEIKEKNIKEKEELFSSSKKELEELQSRKNEFAIELGKISFEQKKIEVEKESLLLKEKELKEKEKLVNFNSNEVTELKNKITSLEQILKEKEIKLAVPSEKKKVFDKTSFLNEMEQNNITVKEQTQNGETYYYFEIKDCKFKVIPAKNILIGSKEVRRGFKYMKEVMEWNCEDFNYMYAYTDHEVSCHYIYEDLNKTIDEIVNRINTLM